jgi:hypothetical protein
MVATDFSDMLRPSNRRGGDLTTAPLPFCWPVPEGDARADDAALQRLEYSVNQQKKFFEVDPTAHFVKAVTDDGEIASVARWNFFPHGYEFEKNHLVDVGEFVPEGVIAPHGPFRLDFYRHLIERMMRLRRTWIPDKPAWGAAIFEAFLAQFRC